MKKIILFISILFSILRIHAQPLSVDTTFQPYFTFYTPGDHGEINGIYFDENDKIIVYGDFVNLSIPPPYGEIIRMDSYGNKESNWFYNALGDGAYFLTRSQNDFFYSSLLGQAVLKVNLNGIRTDTAWDFEFNNRDKQCYAISPIPYIFPDQSMFLGGYDCKCKYETANIRRNFMRILPNGKTDTLFQHNTNGYVTGTFKYSPGQLILTGGGLSAFTKYDSIPAIRMCRIDTTGNLDTTFKTNFTLGNPLPVHIQSDGKILVGGFFKIANNARILNLIRLNSNGSLDSTFNNFNSVNDSLDYSPSAASVMTACPTPDGGFLIGGTFKHYQGYNRNKIVKTDGDGYIDTTYFYGDAIADTTFYYPNNHTYVRSIKQTPDGKYYVMGLFSYYNGKKVNPIFRLNSMTNGINENINGKTLFNVYPNPAHNYITFNIKINSEFQLQIFNLFGQMVFKKLIVSATTTIDIQMFTKGMYYYNLIKDDAKIMSGKFIKN